MTLPSDYQTFIALSRYARFRDDLGRRETWEETVERYIEFLVREKCDDKTTDSIRRAILNLEVMPSMRLLMTAGPAARRCNVGAYNCSFLAIDNPVAFAEVLYVLMCGTGVGFSVEPQYISKLPVVPEEIYSTDTVIVFGDSKIGWAKGFKELMSLLYAGFEPKIDYSKIRPAGTRLKTFGGRASGPEPLKSLCDFTVSKFKGAAGRRLNSLEVHDIICKIGEIVVSGGVRRSALISLSAPSDDRMRNAKSGQWWTNDPQRALANNSAVYTERPEVGQFLTEWTALYESKSGERGIFNRNAAAKQVQKTGRREARDDWGCNPCCVPADCLILTEEGYQPIGSLEGKKTVIWNGNRWSEVTPFFAGEDMLVRVHLTDGTSLDCTPNHKFITVETIKRSSTVKRLEAKELLPGMKLENFRMPVIEVGKRYEIDAYSQGFYSGDGCSDLRHSWVYEPKYDCIPRLAGVVEEKIHPSSPNRKVWKHGPMLDKTWVPVDGSLTYCLNWLAGLCDADASVVKDENGNGLQVASVDKVFLLQIRLMLTRLGVQAKLTQNRANAGLRDIKGVAYNCQGIYRLCINHSDTHHLIGLGLNFNRLKLHSNPPQRDARRFVKVKSVELLSRDKVPVYCFEEPYNNTGVFNGIVTGQSEIILRPQQMCNLSEVVVRPEDTLESLKGKVRIASIMGTLQSTLTSFKFLRKVWQQNCEEERLLGVSLTGIMDHPILSGSKATSEQWQRFLGEDRELSLAEALAELKQVAVETNKEWAQHLGINQSTAITCLKPSGTVSALVDSASGIHARFAPYYIRTVRADKKDPLAKFMVDLGFPVEDCVMRPNDVWVFSFPMKSPAGAVVSEDRSAVEQLDTWKLYQDFWCEHKPSVTINVKESEWLDVGAWVFREFDSISGVSFLPWLTHSYQQAPYQVINQEQYEELLSRMPKSVDWKGLSEYETAETTTGDSREFACSANSCEVVDIGV